MNKFNVFLWFYSIINVFNTFSSVMCFSNLFGPRFYHSWLVFGVFEAFEVYGGETASDMQIHVLRLLLLFAVLFVIVYFVLRILLLEAEKTRVLLFVNRIIAIDFAIDAFACFISMVSNAIQVQNGTRESNWIGYNPYLFTVIYWSILLVFTIVMINSMKSNKDNKNNFIFAVVLFCANLISYYTCCIYMMSKYSALVSNDYILPFVFFENVILCILLAMYQKEIKRYHGEQFDVDFCPDDEMIAGSID